MKRNHFLRYLLSFALSFVAIFAMAKSKNDIAQVDTLYNQLQREGVTITINRVISSSVFNTAQFDPQGTLTFESTKTVADLPYFGVMTNAPFSMDGGGIDFDTTPKDIDMEIKKDRVELAFEALNGSELFQVRINMYPNHRVYMQIYSTDRELNTYDGYFELGVKKPASEK